MNDLKTRQEAQSILNQIAQLRNTLKEQEAVTSAYLMGNTNVEMETNTSVQHNPSDNFQSGDAKLSNLANVAAATTLGSGDRGEQITSVLSSSLIVLDNLDTIDAAAFGHGGAVDSKRSGVKGEDEARGSSELSGAGNAESINIRISSDSDLDTESYFSDFNIKRFSSKRGNGGSGGAGSSGDN